jgi:hypothetical protein
LFLPIPETEVNPPGVQESPLGLCEFHELSFGTVKNRCQLPPSTVSVPRMPLTGMLTTSADQHLHDPRLTSRAKECFTAVLGYSFGDIHCTFLPHPHSPPQSLVPEGQMLM